MPLLALILVAFVDAAHAMGGGPDQGGGNPILSLLPFALMFAVLYFLILKPQIKKQKDQQKMVDGLEKGNRIVTNGGIHGLITNIKDDILIVKISENTRIELSRGAVSKVKEAEDK